MKLTLEEKLQNVKLHVDDGVPLFEIVVVEIGLNPPIFPSFSKKSFLLAFQ